MNDSLIRALVLAKTRGRCFYCGEALNSRLEVALGKEDWHIDHIVPVSQGGSDGLDNLVPSCARCNRSKGNLTAEEFIRSEVLRRGILSRALRPPIGFPIS